MTNLAVNLPAHGEIGYDTDLNAAITAIVSAINTILADIAAGTGGGGTAPNGDLAIVNNGDNTFTCTVTGADVTITDNTDNTFTVTITQPAQLVMTNNGDGSFGVTT